MLYSYIVQTYVSVKKNEIVISVGLRIDYIK